MIPLATLRREQGDVMRARISHAITDLTAQHSRPPTNREIGRYLGGKSTGHIDWHLRIMKAEGTITHRPNTARGVSIPGVICAGCAGKDVRIGELERELAALRADIANALSAVG